jgi:hypothetical protein
MIATDIFIEIGSQHKVCEDYIISGMEPEPYIILADGCSSSNDTEMGARILCHLAKQYLRYRSDDLHNIDHKKMGRWIIPNAEMAARQMGLKVSCLDATLIVSFFIDGEVKIFMYGDGVVVIKSGNDIEYFKIDFSSNAPYYLSYLIDDHRHELYHQMRNDLIITTHYNNNFNPLISNYAYDFPIEFTRTATEFDVVFISSDGLTSFIDDNPTARTSHPIEEIIGPFMEFKGTKGEYLKRRMKNALKKLGEIGIVHFDDLSIGSYISVKEE